MVFYALLKASAPLQLGGVDREGVYKATSVQHIYNKQPAPHPL